MLEPGETQHTGLIKKKNYNSSHSGTEKKTLRKTLRAATADTMYHKTVRSLKERQHWDHSL